MTGKVGDIRRTGGPNRRSILQGGAFGGALAGLGLVVSPAVIRAQALASSGEVNFMGWSGYKFDVLFDAFTRSTGIRVHFLDQPDQDTMYAKAKIALQTGGIDLVEPTLDRVPAWISNGLVQPWDTGQVDLATYDPAFVTGSAGKAGQKDGKRYFLPSVWGTEAITRSTKDAKGAKDVRDATSLADLFDPRYEGKVTLRAHSSLAALGRVLDAAEKLPKPFLDSHRDPDTMKLVWDVILAEAIKHKSNVARFWSGENDAQAAFRTDGCELGLTWDSTGYNLRKDGLPFAFVAPKEGAFAWLQGYCLHAKATNVEQAAAFANFVSGPDGSALNATAFSANPAGLGGIEKMDAEVTKFYKAAYPGDAVSKLWWWPAQEAWFLRMRGEYADKWKAA